MSKYRWEPNLIVILEARDLIKLDINKLIESLITNEYTLKRGEDEGKQKKIWHIKQFLVKIKVVKMRETCYVDEKISKTHK